MKRYLIFCIAIGWAGILQAQSFKEIPAALFIEEMQPVITRMSQHNSKLQFKKEIFKDIHSNELISSATGVIYYGNGIVFRMENEGVTIIQTNELYVIIDSVERIVQLASPDSSFNPSKSLANLNLENLSKLKLSSFSTDAYTSYKVVPENPADGIIEYQVDRKSHFLYRFKVYYPAANYFSEDMEDETLEEPYAVIVYEPIQKLKDPQNLFNLEPILFKKSTGEYQLTERMTDYELYDSRYQSTNE